ncbi:B-box zinc finger protein 21-like [Trifolium pratense]|uniref:B-box zinc finger protein 21-like n=1 Tax=Trifolium pratense TaxID=57577 RepID=UPI001E697FB9|nr:B-box zinc finger protein 21-like [Trifolium pratense]
MKIQCDVCNKHQASLFCTADEAALCSACDHRVHHANKLASKHHRFSLNDLNSPNHLPLCDICHERKGFVFCQEDRAIVCKDCDLKTHAANEHTKKHNRFLLSGIKLLSHADTSLSPAPPAPPAAISKGSLVITNNEEAGSFTISEYLINTIPGWKFEDFIDSSSSFSSSPFDTILVPQAPQSSFYYSEKMDSR